MVRHSVLSGGRYPVLRALAIFYLLLSVVTLVAGIAGAIYVLAAFHYGNMIDRTFIAIGSLVATFYVVITMLAIAEILKLAIDVEHNTRMGAAAANGKLGVAQSVSPTTMMPTGADTTRDGGRLGMLDEETAEAALIRGH
jgi:hypothetical protein